MHDTPRAARLAWLLVPCVLLSCALSQARAQFATIDYESERLQLFMDAAHLERDPAPDGKTIAYVRYERRRVFEPDDLRLPIVLPAGHTTWPNTFHWLSDESLVRAELLLHPHGVYSSALAEESARNLRALPNVFALVRIVAVKTRDPQQVGVLVYTRDLWSLRFEQEFAGTGTTFAAGGDLVETNFLGLGKSLGVRAQIDPLRFSAGQTYLDPRVLLGQLRLYETVDVIFNRASEHAEGGIGTLSVSRPFYNLAQPTSYELSGAFASYVNRATRDGRVVGFNTDPDPAQHGKICEPGQPGCLSRVWRDRRLQLVAAVHYAIGQRYKQTFTFAAAYADRAVAPNAETGLADSERATFAAEVLPHVRRDIYPYLRYRLALPDYSVFTNLGTFGLSESVQIGPSVDATLGVPLRAYGASSDGVILRASMGYVLAQHDALLQLAGQAWSRLEQGRVVDQRGVLQLRGATPLWTLLAGRFAFRAIWDARRNDTALTYVALGGDTGLRGYASQAFSGGTRYVLGNLEYRSLPLPIQSVRVGFVAFYDLGTVYQRLSRLALHHSVGAGLRMLFPQFSTSSFRIDVGFPLERKSYAVLLAYGSDQVIPLTPSEDLNAESRLAGLP